MRSPISSFMLLWLATAALQANEQPKPSVYLQVLGVAQDAGYPQLNCYRPHCMQGWQDPKAQKFATSLGLVDEFSKHKYLFEATPDIREQMHQLHQVAPDGSYALGGIFLTHAHMGHYTGLMHLGREAAGTRQVPVFVMPKFKQFLQNNGPWSQLVQLENIVLHDLANQQPKRLSKHTSVTPVLVPHRDEFSETVGFYIQGPSKTAFFVPDIDKWQKWGHDITTAITEVDYALLDATFFANGEIPNRDMSEIPHPFVTESMALFKDLPLTEKNKVIFIHFNHSNPLIDRQSEAAKQVQAAGFKVAHRGLKIKL